MIREAVPQESEMLQRLQTMAPQGKSLVFSSVNIPDFFSRTRAYETAKVFNAYEKDRIIGSAACAIRDAVLVLVFSESAMNSSTSLLSITEGEVVAGSLREGIESYLSGEGVALSYATIMEGNVPSMRFVSTAAGEACRQSGLRNGIEQLFCIYERDDRILESMKGLMRVDTGVNLYVKPLQPDVSMTDAPVAMTGFDMC